MRSKNFVIGAVYIIIIIILHIAIAREIVKQTKCLMNKLL